MNYKSQIENCLVFHVLLEYDVNGSEWPRFWACMPLLLYCWPIALHSQTQSYRRQLSLWTISQVCSASSTFCLTSVSEIKKYNVSQLEQICSKSVSEPEYQSKLKTIRKNCVTKKSQSTRKKLCHNPNFRFDSCHSPCSVNGPRSSCENKTKIWNQNNFYFNFHFHLVSFCPLEKGKIVK